MPRDLQTLCAMFGGHKPNPSDPDRCITCGAWLNRDRAPGGNPAAVPTCSACSCSMRWDMTAGAGEGDDVPGAWVCVGCDELPGSCECEVAPLEADVPHVAREEVGGE
ncbi:hypothetical protein NR798_24215 [Archangium gephyra]|uniref:hypothetical protein n=1 Tax=Archangium gephyra TaxID=48 RepID=UPI0035D4B5E2